MLTTVVWAVNIKVCCAFNNVSILVVVIWVVVHNKFSVHWGIICKLTIMLQNEFWPQEMHSLFVKLVVTRENIIFIDSINVPRGFGKTNFCMRVTFSSASQSWIDDNGNTWFIYLHIGDDFKQSNGALWNLTAPFIKPCFGGFDFSSNNFKGIFVSMKIPILFFRRNI